METRGHASDNLFNMLKTITRIRATAVLAFLCAGVAEAALIAHYDFSDGELLDNEVGAEYTLRPMKNAEKAPARTLAVAPKISVRK